MSVATSDLLGAIVAATRTRVPARGRARAAGRRSSGAPRRRRRARGFRAALARAGPAT